MKQEQKIIRESLQSLVIEESVFNNNIKKDYVEKIKTKLYCDGNTTQVAEDINKIIILMNFCFYTKNNFFIANFNTNVIHKILVIYNTLKSNAITENSYFNNIQEFMGINKSNIKLMRFILKRYKNNYDVISANMPLLTNQVDLESIKRVLAYLEK